MIRKKEKGAFMENMIFRSGYEEENIYAKVDDMTYYPVVSSLPHDENKHNIINNLLVTDQLQTKTLDLHQVITS